MRTLLLADDSITVQRVIALTFAPEKIRVVAVGDGQQAIEKMAAERPDIVLAGTTLPQVSGYDLARFMRGKAELRNVPVLLLSGAFETVDEARLAASGANGILEKPVEPKLVISRVKELLGLKSGETPATPGRLITPADAPAEKKPPVVTPPRAATPASDTPSTAQPDLDTYADAFDSLDNQLSGRVATRNPSGPIGSSAGAADPRSPGRTPSAIGTGTGNPVFEVDDDWFGSAESQARANARAGRSDIAEDLGDQALQGPPPVPAPPAGPVFEVDEDWFADDDKARAARQLATQELAKEMGIHEVELPEAPAPPDAPAAVSDLDFAFGIEDFKAKAAEPPPEPVVHDETVTSPASKVTDGENANTAVADDFAALLAFETGERKHPPAAPLPEIKIVAPEVTSEMLEQIASRVADRLKASTFGTKLLSAMAATMRETIRDVVAAASERIIRDAVPGVVAETSERLIRDAAPAVVAETSERVVRDTAPAVVAEASARVVRDTVPAIAAEASARFVRETVPGMVAEASERLVRDAVPGVVAETSERLVRGTLSGVVYETTERIVREAVPAAVAETSERLVRNSVDQVLTETSERLVNETVRTVVSETSERLVRDEIERIKSKKA